MSYVERLVVNEESRSTILYDEHIVRYHFVAPFVADKIILDSACGSGYGTALLARSGAKRLIGIDLDNAAIKEARANYAHSQIEFVIGDATRLELADKSIDIVTSFETIEHLNDVNLFLKEIKRVLKDDGLAFISTPNKTVFGQKNPFHVKEFTKEEFTTVLQEYFPVVRIFEQKNGFASTIDGTGQGTVLVNDNNSEALYFIAVCSLKEITETFSSVASVNTQALKRWENNPAWKLINTIYSLFH